MPADTVTLIQKIQESGIVVWIFMGILMMLGTTVRYLKSLGKKEAISVRNWVIEIIISSFVSIMAGLLCVAYEVDWIWSFVIIGLASHEGTRALYLFRNWLYKKWDIYPEKKKS